MVSVIPMSPVIENQSFSRLLTFKATPYRVTYGFLEIQKIAEIAGF